jgi:CDP-glucose 4,6-dehydratase
MAERESALESVEIARLPNASFWAAQRVFLTGHTGFKGAWLSLWLETMGAQVSGLALPPETEPNLFDMLRPFEGAVSQFADVRDFAAVKRAVDASAPTLAIHMAAQPLVRRSYREPLETFATNVMGTANVLEALRGAGSLKAVVVITTDKVYRNLETGTPFAESDALGGHDPYSASKAAAEIVAASWAESYFTGRGVSVATVRAGNVIGGGDWSEDRLIPDVWRAARAGKPVELRYPNATRPWQHVLEPLAGYLEFAEDLGLGRGGLPPSLNFGPATDEELPVSEVAQTIGRALGAEQGWKPAPNPEYAEMKLLALDSRLATQTLNWRPRLTARGALEWTAEWYRRVHDGENARSVTLEQINRYAELP